MGNSSSSPLTNVLVIGAESSGKSSLIEVLTKGKKANFESIAPTTHYEKPVKYQKMNMMDMPGNNMAHMIWKSMYPVAQAVVFVVDGSKPDDDLKADLKILLDQFSSIGTKPVAILVNKSDVKQQDLARVAAMVDLKETMTVEDGFGKDSMLKRELKFFSCSRKSSESVSPALQYLTKI